MARPPPNGARTTVAFLTVRFFHGLPGLRLLRAAWHGWFAHLVFLGYDDPRGVLVFRFPNEYLRTTRRKA